MALVRRTRQSYSSRFPSRCNQFPNPALNLHGADLLRSVHAASSSRNTRKHTSRRLGSSRGHAGDCGRCWRPARRDSSPPARWGCGNASTLPASACATPRKVLCPVWSRLGQGDVSLSRLRGKTATMIDAICGYRPFQPRRMWTCRKDPDSIDTLH